MAARDVQALSSHWGGQHAYDYTGKIGIERVRLNSGGYAPGGRYFGRGAPLWEIVNEESGGSGDVYFYIRAANKAAARALIQDAYPGARSGQRRRR